MGGRTAEKQLRDSASIPQRNFRDDHANERGPEWSPDPWEGVACRVSFLRSRNGAPGVVELGKVGSVQIENTGSGIPCEFSAQGVLVTDTAARSALPRS